MFVRPVVRQATKLRAAEFVRSEEPSAPGTTVQRLERPRADLRSTSPLRLLGRNILRIAGALLLMVAMAAAIPQQPSIDAVAGESVPSMVVPVGTVLAKADNLTESQNHEITIPGTSD